MRLMRRVSIIKLREASHSMLADVLKEAFNKIFRSSVEHISHHPEAKVDVRSKKYREGTALMVCKVTVDLRALIYPRMMNAGLPVRARPVRKSDS